MERPPSVEINASEARKREVQEYLDQEGTDMMQAAVEDVSLKDVDVPQAVSALRLVAEHMLQNTLIGREEQVADAILQKMKIEVSKETPGPYERRENPELWLMTPTGQLVLAFLRHLVQTKPKELYGLPGEEKKSAREENTVECTRAFFDTESRLLTQALERAKDLLVEMESREEFILPTPHPPITQVPRNDVLCDQARGHRFREVQQVYFLENDQRNNGRPRIDFAVRDEDCPVYGLQTPEEQARFIRETEAANSGRFPVCALFDPTKTIEAGTQNWITTPELRVAVETEGYVFSTIDTALSYGQYAWDEDENVSILSMSSPFTDSDGLRSVPCLQSGISGRWLVARWLDHDRDRHVRFLVLHRGSAENLTM